MWDLTYPTQWGVEMNKKMKIFKKVDVVEIEQLVYIIGKVFFCFWMAQMKKFIANRKTSSSQKGMQAMFNPNIHIIKPLQGLSCYHQMYLPCLEQNIWFLPHVSYQNLQYAHF